MAVVGTSQPEQSTREGWERNEKGVGCGESAGRTGYLARHGGRDNGALGSDGHRSYAVSMDVPQSSAVPLCPQDPLRRFCEKEKLVPCCCEMCYRQRS